MYLDQYDPSVCFADGNSFPNADWGCLDLSKIDDEQYPHVDFTARATVSGGITGPRYVYDKRHEKLADVARGCHVEPPKPKEEGYPGELAERDEQARLAQELGSPGPYGDHR